MRLERVRGLGPADVPIFTINGAGKWPRMWGQAREWMRTQLHHRPDTVLRVLVYTHVVAITDELPHEGEVVAEQGTWMNGIWETFVAHCQMKEIH